MAFKRSGVRLPLAPPLIPYNFSVISERWLGARTVTQKGTTAEPRYVFSGSCGVWGVWTDNGFGLNARRPVFVRSGVAHRLIGVGAFPLASRI